MPQLFLVVDAGTAHGIFLCRLQGRHEHGSQDRNDGNYNQQFNKSEFLFHNKITSCFFY